MRRLLALPLVVAATGLAPTAAAGGGGCGEPITAGRTTTVRIVHACFGPTIVAVPAGATVRWENRSGMPHNISSPGWYVDHLAEGYGVQRRFTAPGVYPYACTLHIGMTGAVVVGNSTGAPAVSGGFVDNVATFPLAGRQPAASAAEAETNAAGAEANAGVAAKPAAKPAARVATETAAGDSGSDALGWIAGGLLVLVAAALAIGRRTSLPKPRSLS